jgi:hypothetical protein
MIDNTQIPEPIKFNPLKHHLGCILRFLEQSTPVSLTRLNESLCHNYNDIYTGRLTPLEISLFALAILKKKELDTKEKLEAWIASTSHYRKIMLPDHSEWITRMGNEPQRYIHIHPAKSGPNTVRFKGSTLKTAYRLKAEPVGSTKKITLTMVNRARADMGLSPVKKLEPGKGILKCWSFFSHQRISEKLG